MTIADLLERPKSRRAVRVLSEGLTANFRHDAIIFVLSAVAVVYPVLSAAGVGLALPSSSDWVTHQPRNRPEIWARSGAQLVVPWEPTETQLREGMVPARLHDGGVLFAPLKWIGPDSQPNRPSRADATQSAGARLIAQRAAAWMDAETEWESLDAPAVLRRASPPTGGGWYLTIDIPPQTEGKDIVLAGRRLSTGWIRRVPFIAPRRTQAPTTGWGEACLAATRRSPFSRWRARLASGEPLVAPGPARDEFADQALESLAEQIESEWAEALDRLAAADSSLAAEVRSRLTLRLDFNGIEVPAWPAEDPSSDRMLDELIDPATPAAQRVRQAREWLLSLPKNAAWVSTDAAIIDQQSGKPVAIVSGVTLQPGAGAAAMMLSRPNAARPDEIATLTPGIVGKSLIALSDFPPGDASLEVGIANWRARRAVVPTALPARPPGLLVGSFFRDWTLPTWLASCTDSGDTRAGQTPAGRGVSVAENQDRTAAMLLAEVPIGAGQGTAGPRQWTLYLECKTARLVEQGESDEVVVSLSGKGGDIVLRVFSDGQIVTSQGGSSRATADRNESRWRVWVPLPESTIADGAWIRLGVSRVDATGLRSTWPRPMFPWEDQPPHAAIKLSEWGGVVDRP